MAYLKKHNSNFSIRTLSKKVGIASGYLPMCLARKRVISEKGFQKILPELGLNKTEKHFLSLLRIIETSESPQNRVAALGEMQRLQSYRDVNKKETDVYQYLTNWQYVAIREMVGLKDFKPDAFWIQAKMNFKISLNECKEALNFLEEKGLILKSQNGTYKISTEVLNCREGIYKISLGEFHRQVLELASQSIDRLNRSDRLIIGHTVGLSTDNYEKARQILNEALISIENLGVDDEKNKDNVYHFELTGFALTSSKENK